MQHFADTFAPFPAGAAMVERLVSECGEFSHLAQARLACLVSQRALVDRGRAMPAVALYPQSEVRSTTKGALFEWLLAEWLRPMLDGHDPDFLLLFDVALWPTSTVEQEHVAYHVLCHLHHAEDEFGAPRFGRNGRPMLKLRNHDIERFHAEIARYGTAIEGMADEFGVYAAARAKDHVRTLRLA
jgi:hypothetical protein